MSTNGISTRKAFRLFMHFELTEMRRDGKLDITEDEIIKFIQGIEDDYTFYEKLEEFLQEYIEDFGGNYGL